MNVYATIIDRKRGFYTVILNFIFSGRLTPKNAGIFKNSLRAPSFYNIVGDGALDVPKILKKKQSNPQ